MKPFTITIASPAALEVFQQFADTLPNDGEKWANDLQKASKELEVSHPRLDEVTAHRHLIARLAKKTSASIELGVDVILDDNEGFMADYISTSKDIAEQFSAASMKVAKSKIIEMLGCSEAEYDRLATQALNDADCPEEIKASIRESIGTTASDTHSDSVLDDLANEGKNVVKFPTGRKDN